MKLNNGLRACQKSTPKLLCKAYTPHQVSRRGLATEAPTTSGLNDAHAYCRELVRKHDHESFLTSYFYPRDMQAGFFAIKAFSVELAMIQDNVSNAMIGKMRMQFWRDAVKGIGDGRPPKHPIAVALYDTSLRQKISTYHLKRIVDARDAELSTPSYLTTDTLTSHAESTSSTVLYLLLSLLSLPSSDLSHAASHLGAAQTFATLLRALPYHAKQARMVIPAEITAKHGVIQEEVFRRGPQASGIEDAVFEFATLANDHLSTARSMLVNSEGSTGKVPREAMPVFLAGVPVSNYLRRLEKSEFDAFDPKLQLRDGWLAWQMWGSTAVAKIIQLRPSESGFCEPSALDHYHHRLTSPLARCPTPFSAPLLSRRRLISAATASIVLACPLATCFTQGHIAVVRVQLSAMERLCDEVLQLIFYELDDPSPLTMVAQRFHRFSQDPYVRAHYFLTHYGPIEAMYYALGRGKVVTERVLDILLSSGAQLSRYLIQIAIHHYFHTQSHFIKTQWVRNVPFRVFTYFLKVAEEMYGEIPRGKGEDDGSVFTYFLKESRIPPQMKTISWETIRDLMDTYKFIPFCHRDPIMPQFPLALAIEPRLLPHAIANGFSMDYKHRDFVFRKMFERPTASSEARPEDIAENVRELCKLDPAMFVSRTVAAEVCMEAKVNDVGYSALKLLDKSGDLHFEMSTLIEDLLRTFLKTRSLSHIATGDILLYLFTDFPSTDVSVRLVVLIVVFLAADNLHMPVATVRNKLDAMGMLPITRRDAFNILINPFVEKFNKLVEYALEEITVRTDGSKGMSKEEVESVLEEAAVSCVEIASKGRTLKKLYDGFPTVKNVVINSILSKYQIGAEDVPVVEYGVDNPGYMATLCRDFMRYGLGEVHTMERLMPGRPRTEAMDSDEDDDDDEDDESSMSEASTPEEGSDTDDDSAPQDERAISDLGEISQESLTSMIRQDEAVPVRSRRRILYSYNLSDSAGKLHYPHDPIHVGRWARTQFGPRSAITALFMTHAVLNDNCTMLHHYLMSGDNSFQGVNPTHVPVTFKHFQLLARLGKTPNFYLWHFIEVGAEFYFDEYDYLSKSDVAKIHAANRKVKVEASQGNLSGSPLGKRPRRSAAATVSYAVPDSDDEAIADEDFYQDDKKKRGETNLQLWIKHLTQLLKTETRRYMEAKKRLEKDADGEKHVRIQKNDFVKSLTTNLRTLRKLDSEKRTKSHYDDAVEDVSEDEDGDEYRQRRTKRRKTAHA